MYYKRKRLVYDILIPNLEKPVEELDSHEAEAYFDWYMSKLSERIEYLQTFISGTKKYQDSTLDLSPESLIPLWSWFLSIAEIEKTPKKYRFLSVIEDDEQLSLQTEDILNDIGMYLGSVIVKNVNGIRWGYYTEPKTDFFVNMPLLLGFVDKDFTPPFKMEFEPIHMAGVQAANLFDHTQNEMDLYNLYEMYQKHKPE